MQMQLENDREVREVADSVLVQRALNGNQEAFEEIVCRYKNPLVGLIHQYISEYHEVKDILQQVWLQLYLSPPSLRPHVQLKPWLLIVARNCSLDYLQCKQARSRCLLLFCELEAKMMEDEVPFLDMIPDITPHRRNMPSSIIYNVRYRVLFDLSPTSIVPSYGTPMRTTSFMLRLDDCLVYQIQR